MKNRYALRRRSRLLSVLAMAAFAVPSLGAESTRDIATFLAPYKGKVVLLDFWASWCGPCRRSFPWMDDLQSRYRDAGLIVIAVNLDQDRKLAEEFLALTRPKFRIEYDATGTLATALDVTSMPSSFVIDQAGKIRERHLGFKDAQRESRERSLQQLLVEK